MKKKKNTYLFFFFFPFIAKIIAPVIAIHIVRRWTLWGKAFHQVLFRDADLFKLQFGYVSFEALAESKLAGPK